MFLILDPQNFESAVDIDLKALPDIFNILDHPARRGRDLRKIPRQDEVLVRRGRAAPTRVEPSEDLLMRVGSAQVIPSRKGL